MGNQNIINEEKGNDVNHVLPAVYFGVFKIASKNKVQFPYINANQLDTKECELLTAYDIAFETREKAIESLDKLPRPALYTILPVYLCL